MFKWSDRFETGIALVDEQHQELFRILNRLYACIEEDQVDADVIDRHLTALGENWQKHFIEEQALMEEKGLSERHIKLHEMEHHAFAHDVQRLLGRRSTQEEPLLLAKQSASFIATWLSLHILGIDQSMARQIREIERGRDPEVAYKLHEDFSVDRKTTRAIVNALLEMWREAEDRCEDLRQELEATLARA